MQWANLPELHQTPTLDDSDLDCLEEIRGVLSRHGKLARFAVHLGPISIRSRTNGSAFAPRTDANWLARLAASLGQGSCVKLCSHL